MVDGCTDVPVNQPLDKRNMIHNPTPRAEMTLLACNRPDYICGREGRVPVLSQGEIAHALGNAQNSGPPTWSIYAIRGIGLAMNVCHGTWER